ncbi:type IV pilus secretin PilQ [Porticoccus sp. W117]|uniref:type IV pilus secretin PilQ n=1 Tax=Porticoccus sp. W117 TaxID=3054777 RepID=UPI002595E142|nr:type IV pilus secretin PilQ [Porticoccus sp. W117]MDM3870919.1 type IV pilus secretin PilQ [Porticoccus sp. W117]
MNRHINKTISTLFAALACWATSLVAAAEPVTLDKVDFASLPGDRFQVVMTFSDTPPQSSDLAMADPARLVMDFPGVQSKLEEKRYSLSFENARNFTALTAGERTRVVLSLQQMVPYQSRVDGNVLTLEVGASASQVADVAQAAKVHTAGYNGDVSGSVSVSNVDFERGEGGEGRVIIDLSDANVNIDINQVGSEIQVNFYQTALPGNLDRRLDVVDFATPVKAIDSIRRGSTTHVAIDALGEFEYSAYQVDTQYVIEVKPLTPRELEEQRNKFAYSGEKMTLNFQDVSVRAVLSVIADQVGINIVVSDAVDGSITLNLNDVPWDHALDVILKTKGLDKRQEGNVIHVGLAEDIAEQERLQVEVNKQLQELAPLRTEYVRISYANAEELFELYRGERAEGAEGSLDRGELKVDSRTNTIIITDTEENIADFRRLVRELDIPIRQVRIEARIVTANTDFREELGVEWGVAGGGTFNGNNIFGAGANAAFDSDNGGVIENFDGNPATSETLNLTNIIAADLGVNEPTGSLALAFLSDNLFLDLELSALESAGHGEVVAQPSITTGDKQEAMIRTGQEVPFLEATSSGAASLQFKEALLQLQVTPQITPDNRINMDLLITQDAVSGQAIGLANSTVPIIDVTSIETTALVGDGQTIVLGGIFQLEERKDTRKVPLLGDIPYVGRLFRNETDTYEKREILIFITPKIIDEALNQ